MIATKQCLKCPWKTDVGNKLVCMFKWCVYNKFKKNKINKESKQEYTFDLRMTEEQKKEIEELDAYLKAKVIFD
jgi:glutaredoxin